MTRYNYGDRTMRINRRSAQITAFLVVLPLWGMGQASTLTQFFGALEARPELEAANAALRAAEAGLAQARNPVALDLNVSAAAPAAELVPFSDARGRRRGEGLSVSLRSNPATWVRLRELDLGRAQLALQEARAFLEARAYESALALELSRESLTLTRSSAEAGAAAYTAAQLRFERGLVTTAELRDADANRQRAWNLVASAETAVTLAEDTLESLVGDARLETLPQLEVSEATFAQTSPLTVRRAAFDVTAAQIGQDGAARPFYPVAELTYDYDVTYQNRVSASISSQDLAPRVGYSFDYSGYDEAPQLSLRVSATIAPEQFDNVTRLAALRQGAEASLEAAQQDATVTGAQLRSRLAETGRNAQLAALVFKNAKKNLAEVRVRETLGAGTPLETQAAAAALAEAGLAVRDARPRRGHRAARPLQVFWTPRDGPRRVWRHRDLTRIKPKIRTRVKIDAPAKLP